MSHSQHEKKRSLRYGKKGLEKEKKKERKKERQKERRKDRKKERKKERRKERRKKGKRGRVTSFELLYSFLARQQQRQMLLNYFCGEKVFFCFQSPVFSITRRRDKKKERKKKNSLSSVVIT